MSLTVKNQTDPSYLARGIKDFGNGVAAGAAGVTSKWVAHANLLLFSLNAYTTTLGTSTYTVNGTATLSGQQLSLIIVSDTNTTTVVGLGTTTVGPFYAGGVGLTTAAVGGYNQFALNTSTGTSGFGGLPVPQGSIVYVVSGTDATAQTALSVDWQHQVGAPLTQ
jgi:hypothetical protein